MSVFGTFDAHVPDGSALDGATNVRVPVAGHFRVLAAPETLLAVRDGIARISTPDDDRMPRASRHPLRVMRVASARLAGLHRADAVGPHHLVVLVLDDVAVPDELARRVELARTRVTWPG